VFWPFKRRTAWKEHFEKGMAAGGAGDVEAALPHFREAIRLAPLEPYPHYELGYTLFLLGQCGSALAELRRTNELAEGFFLVQTEIYMCEAVLSGLLDHESIATLRQLQRLTDSGRAQSSEAISLSRQLISRAPTCALGHYYLGKALFAEDSKASEEAPVRALPRSHGPTGCRFDRPTESGSG
jgi:tetratricopeptide (TPR) repeat protein